MLYISFGITSPSITSSKCYFEISSINWISKLVAIIHNVFLNFFLTGKNTYEYPNGWIIQHTMWCNIHYRFWIFAPCFPQHCDSSWGKVLENVTCFDNNLSAEKLFGKAEEHSLIFLWKEGRVITGIRRVSITYDWGVWNFPLKRTNTDNSSIC